MKKYTLVLFFALLGLTVQAQDQFRAGINLGLPVGDAGDITTFNIAIDLGYLLTLQDLTRSI